MRYLILGLLLAFSPATQAETWRVTGDEQFAPYSFVQGDDNTPRGLDVELVNWRGIVAAPGITPEQRNALSAAVEKTVKSPEWAKILKARGWDDAYLPSDQFATFMKADQARVKDILASIGLVK